MREITFSFEEHTVHSFKTKYSGLL